MTIAKFLRPLLAAVAFVGAASLALPASAAVAYGSIYATPSAIVCSTDAVCATISNVQVLAVTYNSLVGSALYQWDGVTSCSPDAVFYVRPTGATHCFVMKGFMSSSGGSYAPSASGVLPAANGGAGTINGALKADGSGTVSQAAASDLSNGVTGSGAVVLATNGALTTPNLGTPSAVVLTNATGLPATTGITGSVPIANGGTAGTTAATARANLAAAVSGSNGDITALTALTNPLWPTIGTIANLTGTNWTAYAYAANHAGGLNVMGYYTAAGGGGGMFRAVASCTVDTGTCLQDSAGNYFQRIINGATISNLALGAHADGTTDDTSTILPTAAAAIANHVVAYIAPNSVFTGVNFTSTYNGLTIHFDHVKHKVSVVSIGTEDSAVYLTNVSNVTLYGDFDGQRASQPANEHIYNVEIDGGSNISIPYLNCIETRGDCEYVARDGSGNVPTNITQGPLSCVNSARDGRNALTIISAKTMTVNGLLSNLCGGTVNGTLEPGGFDIEPNATADTVDNIVITGLDVVCVSCYSGVGVLIGGGVAVSADHYTINNVSISGRLKITGSLSLYGGRFNDVGGLYLNLQVYGDTTLDSIQGPTIDDAYDVSGFISAANFGSAIFVGANSTYRVANAVLTIDVQDYGVSSGGPSGIGFTTKLLDNSVITGLIGSPTIPTARNPYNGVRMLASSVMNNDTFSVSVIQEGGNKPSYAYLASAATTTNNVVVEGANLRTFSGGAYYAVGEMITRPGFLISGNTFVAPFTATTTGNGTTAGATTCDSEQCSVTTESLTTAAGACYVITYTNSQINSNSVFLITPSRGSNTVGPVTIGAITPGAGSATIPVCNGSLVTALSGTVKLLISTTLH